MYFYMCHLPVGVLRLNENFVFVVVFCICIFVFVFCCICIAHLPVPDMLSPSCVMMCTTGKNMAPGKHFPNIAHTILILCHRHRVRKEN